MDAIDVLRADHDFLRDLLDEFADADGPQAKVDAGRRFIQALLEHHDHEERAFYPPLQSIADPASRSRVLEGEEQHRIADRLARELDGHAVADESFVAKFQVLAETTRRHFHIEERELFPLASTRMRDELDPMGARLMEMRAGSDALPDPPGP